MSSSSSDPGRRNSRSHQAILRAVIELVAEHGYEHVSIEAIARHAGVGKQTIYRWWPSKGAVVLEASAESLGSVTGVPDTGDVVADFRTQMLGVTEMLSDPTIGPMYRGLIAAAQSDPVLARAHLDRMVEPVHLASRARLLRARDQGDIRHDADLQVITELLYGVLSYRMLLTTHPLGPEEIENALTIVFSGARPPAPDADAG